jgi:tungstate transport system substrate-binding protein
MLAFACGRRLLVIGILAIVPWQTNAQDHPRPGKSDDRQTVRCAVVGGLAESGLWQAIADRFNHHTGHTAEVVAQGNKHVVVPQFEEGNIDLLTMHASDAIVNLVADGLAANPQPWVRNDMLLVGPPGDPAGIRGEKDVVRALAKIIESDGKLLMHASQGANEMLTDLLAAGDIPLDPERVISLPSDRQRQMMQRAAEEQAYTLVGRIPFLNNKIARHGMEIMVQGDKRLRRPYLVVVSTEHAGTPRHAAAQELARFLRSPETQAWLKDFGRGTLDAEPLFFPVELRRPE